MCKDTHFFGNRLIHKTFVIDKRGSVEKLTLYN